MADSAAANRARASADGRRTQYSMTPLADAASVRQPASGLTGGQEIQGTGRSSPASANGTITFAMFSGGTPKSHRCISPGRWRVTPTTRKSRPAIRIVRPTLSAPSYSFWLSRSDITTTGAGGDAPLVGARERAAVAEVDVEQLEDVGVAEPNGQAIGRALNGAAVQHRRRS